MGPSVKGREGVGDLDNVGTTIIPRAKKVFVFFVPAERCIDAKNIAFSMQQQGQKNSQITNVTGKISQQEGEILVDTSQGSLLSCPQKSFDNPFWVDDHKYSLGDKTVSVAVYKKGDIKKEQIIQQVPLQEIEDIWQKELATLKEIHAQFLSQKQREEVTYNQVKNWEKFVEERKRQQAALKIEGKKVIKR